MSKRTGIEMWQELCSIYDGKMNPAMTAQKVYHIHANYTGLVYAQKGMVAIRKTARNYLEKKNQVWNKIDWCEKLRSPKTKFMNTTGQQTSRPEPKIIRYWCKCTRRFNQGIFHGLQSTEESEWNPTVSVFADRTNIRAEGFGTILLKKNDR
ncbi:hypothetical protein PHPALM_31102 [Phytophthora palmivora]|uniref:Uncharacterized protein n=1 Tax=Phytophthora palmivora TaxID=4796 RepID=A0A2P4X3F1_9STRA|nr:hypothetical protein PHPALM_31102 [Phytophthora palmivora]